MTPLVAPASDHPVPTSAEEAIRVHGSRSLGGGLVVAAERAGPPQQQLAPGGAAQSVALHVWNALDAELCRSSTANMNFQVSGWM